MSSRGEALNVVYVLSNPAMPGLVKIGWTTQDDVATRLGQLYTSGVPFPFDLEFACKVPNGYEVEQALHRAFLPSRINAKREFFKIEPAQVIAILKLLHVEEATDAFQAVTDNVDLAGSAAGKQFKARRPNQNFLEMGLALGSIIRSVDGLHEATISAPRKVVFRGEEMSLTAATMLIREIDYGVQPGPHWEWDGKSLSQIYNETYSPEAG